MRRPLLVGALVTAVVALVASVAVAVSTAGAFSSGPTSGQSMMRGGGDAGRMNGQHSRVAGMMSGSMMSGSMMGAAGETDMVCRRIG